MTDTSDGGDEGVGDSLADSEDRSEGSNAGSESQFEKFHELLDERESNRNRSATEGGTEEGERNETADPAQAMEESADSEAITDTEDAAGDDVSATEGGADTPEDESGGWMWGLPTGFRKGDRIWDDETVDRDVPDESGTSKGTDDALEGSPEVTETSERNRWSEIGASLEEGAVDAAEASAEAEKPIGDPLEDDRSNDGGPATPKPSNETEIAGEGVSNDLDRVTSSSSVLLLGPTRHPVSDAICSRFLTADGESRDVIFVTFDDSPNERIKICHQAEEWSGGKIGIIEVGRGSRNASAASEITSGSRGGSITVRHITNPGDLSKLGIVITQLLSAFNETDRETVLCVHTLSALHREVGTKTLFRFLNTLQGRLKSTNAIGHYHIDPDLHEDIVIETLRPIFETVIRFSAEGDLEIE